MTRVASRLALPLLLLLIATGCGKKGPLYLPDAARAIPMPTTHFF